MRAALRCCLLLAVGMVPCWARANEVTAGAATDLSVTVYRASTTEPEALDLDGLAGFALISETRSISVPAGDSTVRFEGVADSIESDTAIISGLPVGIVEKNRDARTLSPSELVASTLGKKVALIRTATRTGAATQSIGTLRSDNGGVIFESAEGIEALRCSGFPETFSFSGATHLGATPTLSVLLRAPKAFTASVTLSYLARGFDWSANYVATLSADAASMDIGAWVTLANGNAVTFPQAHTQVVAGRLNHETGEVEPIENEPSILAQCWPQGTTSDLEIRAVRLEMPAPAPASMAMAAARDDLMQTVVTAKRVTAQLVEEEQLGDLKLYRVPEPTSVASRQMKQVRLLDRQEVPVDLYYAVELLANQNVSATPAMRTLRTRNDDAHHLGLPLPSGTAATSIARGDTTLLVSESAIVDTALNEELEIKLGDSPDMQVKAVLEQTKVDPANVKELPVLPGIIHLRSASADRVNRIEIFNARNESAPVELHLRLADGTQLISAEPAPWNITGRPLFKLTIPAHSSAIIRYQTEHTSVSLQRH